jgi:hypothetical protein
MLTDMTVTAAHMAYADRLRFAEHELLLAEVFHETYRCPPIRAWLGARLMHVGARLVAPYPEGAPWRTVRLSR